MTPTKTAACLMAFLLASTPFLPLAVAAPAPSSASCAQVDVPASGANPSGGFVSACLTSQVQACAYDEELVWTCRVQYTLSLRVESLVTCGETFSPATPGTPPTVLTCAGLWPSYAVRIVDDDRVQADEQGRVLVTGNWVCARPAGPCQDWVHEYELPPQPVQNAPQDVQATAALVLVVAFVIVSEVVPWELVPADIHFNRNFVEDVEEIIDDVVWPYGTPPPGSGVLP